MKTVSIPFCGPSGQGRSLNVTAERTVNFYPHIDKSDPDKPHYVLYPTPGYSLFTNLTGSIGRPNGLYAHDGVLYAGVDNKFYSVSSAGTPTLLGTLSTSKGVMSFVDNTVQIGLSDGSYGYSYTLSGGAFAQIASNFPASPTNLTYQDGYVLTASGKNVWQANLLDLTTWGSTAFVEPLTFTDNLVAAFSDGRELFLMGSKGTEIRYDSGDTPFAFAKRTDVLLQKGCASAATIKKLDNSLFWLAQDENGAGHVIRLDGYRPQVISTAEVNEAIERYTTISDAFAYTYKEAHSQFYVLVFPTANATWVCDVSAGHAWHERSSYGMGRHFANGYAYCYGKHIVNDCNSGKLYYMSQDYLDEAGTMIVRSRTSPHQEAEGAQIFVHEIEILIESGVGLITGQGSAPLATLEASLDGGHTWISQGTASMGLMGQYRARLTWRRLGVSRIWTFRLTIADPVRCYVLGARGRYMLGAK